MDVKLLSSSSVLLSLGILFGSSFALAQNGDGGGVPPSAAQPTSAAEANADGASGSGASFNLNTGSTVAIIIVVAFVIILGIASTVLWYLAKKRQWKVRETLRRSARRMTETVLSPLTPKSGKFAFSPRTPTAGQFRRETSGGLDDLPAEKAGSRVRATETRHKRGMEEDLEQGLGRTKPKPNLMVKVPGQDVDKGPITPGPLSSKLSGWTKVFGRA